MSGRLRLIGAARRTAAATALVLVGLFVALLALLGTVALLLVLVLLGVARGSLASTLRSRARYGSGGRYDCRCVSVE